QFNRHQRSGELAEEEPVPNSRVEPLHVFDHCNGCGVHTVHMFPQVLVRAHVGEAELALRRNLQHRPSIRNV
ncbi:hypothetical protein AVEN_101351-1, partial [Araneus ventricosus]